jgi:hypothetical protein
MQNLTKVNQLVDKGIIIKRLLMAETFEDLDCVQLELSGNCCYKMGWYTNFILHIHFQKLLIIFNLCLKYHALYRWPCLVSLPKS